MLKDQIRSNKMQNKNHKMFKQKITENYKLIKVKNKMKE